MRVDERDTYFERMRHRGPIHVAQELVAEIERRLERRDAAERRPRIGRDGALDEPQEIEAVESFRGDVGTEDVRKLGGEEAAALHEVRAGVGRAVADDLAHLRADVAAAPRERG